MSAWLIERLHQRVEAAMRVALNATGLEEVEEIRLQPPKDSSMGDLSLPCHPYSRVLRKNPKIIAEEIAAAVPISDGIGSAEATNGFVNLRFEKALLLREGIREALTAGEKLGTTNDYDGQTLLIEFSGPNTNKPQHLGHVRNNILGLVMSNLWEAVGYKVVRTNIINDRGIHICKSMLAYKRWGEGATPASTGRKGDFFVGDYYVLFDKKFNEEFATYRKENPEEEIEKDEYFNTQSKLGAEAKEMLRLWEEQDQETHALWSTMNNWVYEGFDETYGRLGISFDWVDYESETYVLGKGVVEQGLEKGIFLRRDDGAVACDLTQLGKEGQKILLRPDGTSLYMTQDLGTAMRRLEKFDPQRMVYVVADEQNYHFELLFGMLNLVKESFGDRCHHLSYGMVDLPHGRMKSREGTVVDADNLMNELQELAIKKIKEFESDLSDEEILDRAEKIGQAGLKYFILKFTPATRMRFDPEQSIAFEGETGPYCLYGYARVNSIASKIPGVEVDLSDEVLNTLGTDLELAVAQQLVQFPHVVRDAANKIAPSLLARYLFRLAKSFASLYQDPSHRIKDSEPHLRTARLTLGRAVQAVLQRGLHLMGIETIEKM